LLAFQSSRDLAKLACLALKERDLLNGGMWLAFVGAARFVWSPDDERF
jgi:hypothetical protein